MPALGESVTEGTVSTWLKAVGDRVEADEPLLEVATDKVDTEVPSPASGVVEQILVQEDETVEVGTVLAIIGDGSGPSEGSAQEQADRHIAGHVAVIRAYQAGLAAEHARPARHRPSPTSSWNNSRILPPLRP